MKKKNFISRVGLMAVFSVLVGLCFSCREDKVEKELAFLRADKLALSISEAGGNETIKIESNVKSWVATSPQEGQWLELKANANELSIAVKQNTDAKERTGYILIQAAETTPVKIKLTQSAGSSTSEMKDSHKYVLPLLEETPSASAVVRYESNRKGILKSFIEADPEYKAYDDLYFFFNDSELFPETLYAIRATTKSLVEVSTLCDDYKRAVEERQNIINFYKENQFDILSETDTQITGRHKTKPFNLKITYVEGKGVMIRFEQYARQQTAYKTFATMPLFPQEYFENKKWLFEQIKDAEIKAGSQEGHHTPVSVGTHKGKVALATFVPAASKKPLIHVGYYFHWESGVQPQVEGTVKEIAALYDDVSLGFWEDTTITGTYVPTDEFAALLSKNGWEFLGIENGYYGYYNPNSKMMLACKATKLRGINNDNPCVQINYFPAPADVVGQSMNSKVSVEQFEQTSLLYHKLK